MSYDLNILVLEQEKSSKVTLISPIKKIMFLARYQWGDEEIICGVLSYIEFITMLENQEILFNVSYIIGE